MRFRTNDPSQARSVLPQPPPNLIIVIAGAALIIEWSTTHGTRLLPERVYSAPCVNVRARRLPGQPDGRLSDSSAVGRPTSPPAA